MSPEQMAINIYSTCRTKTPSRTITMKKLVEAFREAKRHGWNEALDRAASICRESVQEYCTKNPYQLAEEIEKWKKRKIK